jgi:transcriptional regulator with XRE-family HTH domain
VVETFWERTNRLIKEFGFTQDNLSQICGFDDTRRIRNLSTGGRFPRAKELVRIAKELKTSVEYLVTGEDILTELERDLIDAFNQLNDAGKNAAIGALRGLYASFPQLPEQAGESLGTA